MGVVTALRFRPMTGDDLPAVLALESALQDHLQTRVEVRSGRGGKGSIEIRFHGPDDFERVFELVTGRPVSEVVE